ncbi:MAG: hypothetical protein K6F63_06850, partial [Lachnospiraceae bacterium]|nr:hypothetical protein [Lachnospiraceae bacterium]
MKKITIREKILMVLAFVIVAVVIFENLFLSPLRDETAEIEKDIINSENLITELYAQQMGYNSITTDLYRSMEEYYKTVNKFPVGWNDSEMLRFVEETVGDKLVKNTLTFNGLEKLDTYSKGSYSMTVHGPFYDIIDMLYTFNDAKYFNTVSSVSVPVYSYENEEVDVTFTVNFYV